MTKTLRNIGIGIAILASNLLIDSNIAKSNEIESEPLAKVTSVSQLSDIQPTDWAFQALQSLVERYGCIAGYPDSHLAPGNIDVKTTTTCDRNQSLNIK